MGRLAGEQAYSSIETYDEQLLGIIKKTEPHLPIRVDEMMVWVAWHTLT